MKKLSVLLLMTFFEHHEVNQIFINCKFWRWIHMIVTYNRLISVSLRHIISNISKLYHNYKTRFSTKIKFTSIKFEVVLGKSWNNAFFVSITHLRAITSTFGNVCEHNFSTRLKRFSVRMEMFLVEALKINNFTLLNRGENPFYIHKYVRT